MDPVYRVKFPGTHEVRYTSDLVRLQRQFEQIEPGSYNRFLKLMKEGYKIYDRSMPLISRNYYSLLDPSLIKFPFKVFR